MSVFVDDMQAPFGRMVMCHMIADTRAELLEMADQIGVARKWIQQRGRAGEHFDICKKMRAKAVMKGAVEITMLELAEKTFGRRSEDGRGRYLLEAPRRVHERRTPPGARQALGHDGDGGAGPPEAGIPGRGQEHAP